MSNLTTFDPATGRKVYHNPVIGDKVVFLKSARDTNGTSSLLEIELAPGGGNTLHTHRTFSEIFTALEGELEVQVGKERKMLKPGESATVPPKTLHCFRNPSDKPIRFQVTFRPGHEGMENSLKIAYGLASDGLTNQRSIPRKFSHMALLVTMSDTYPTGLFLLLMPLLRWKARQARKAGIEQELMEKYCR